MIHLGELVWIWDKRRGNQAVYISGFLFAVVSISHSLVLLVAAIEDNESWHLHPINYFVDPSIRKHAEPASKH